MKTLAQKILILAAPFAALLAIELLVLPIDFFTFRPWEAFLVREVRPAEGPFYPDMHLIKVEGADQLGFKDPKPRTNEWFTDKYGFRNRPSVANQTAYDIVVIGDSNIVGSSLDQKEMASEVLARKCRCSVYSYGSGGKRQYLSDSRFKKRPPRAVVAEARTGELYQKKIIDLYYADLLKPAAPLASGLPSSVAILADRIVKQNMVEFLKARLGTAQHVDPGAKDLELSLQERVQYTTEVITQMHDELRKRGSDFVFFMMPSTDRTLDAALRDLTEKGVKTIAFFPQQGLPHGVNSAAYYQEHDSHWRAETVRHFADDVLAKLGWQNYAPEPFPAPYLNPLTLVRGRNIAQ